MQSDECLRDGGFHYDSRRLGVGPDIGFRDRRPVPYIDTAAHNHQAPKAFGQVGRASKRGRQVRKGTCRHDGDIGILADDVEYRVDGVHSRGVESRLWLWSIAEPAGAMQSPGSFDRSSAKRRAAVLVNWHLKPQKFDR